MPVWGAVAAVLILLCGSVARAGETFPSDVRTIAATTATSSCIGDPRTPVCAVETFRACSARQDNALCLRVGGEGFMFQKHPYNLRYRILSVCPLTPRNIPPEFRNSRGMAPGNVEVVLLELPDPTRNTCPEGCKYDYIARPINDEWQIVYWAMWGIPY